MKPLSMQDAGWLALETRNAPMHIGGISLFKPPEGVGPTFLREVFEKFRHGGALRAPFSQHLVGAGRLGLPVLDDDPDIDLDYHVRHSALPSPGSYRDLFVLVSRLHSIPMDLQRPLWECHLIEGLPHGQYATYTKIHHSLVDGTAGVRLMHASLSEDPSARDLPAMWAQAAQDPRASKPRPASPPPLLEQRRVLPDLLRVTREMLGAATGLRPSALSAPWQAPRSLLNSRLSPARRVVCQSWPQARVQAVAKGLGVTLNDIVLAMCGGALRTYLISQNALPSRPLICGVPVALSRAEGNDLGNAISMAFANLGTHLADPAARLKAITGSVQAAKTLLSSLSRPSLDAYSLLAGLPLAIDHFTGLSRFLPPAFNLVISNVPGPRQPKYWNGARLEHVYPISLLPNGQAFNISLMSYAGSLDFGLVACRRSLPHMQRLIDYMEDALVELEQLMGTVGGEARRRA